MVPNVSETIDLLAANAFALNAKAVAARKASAFAEAERLKGEADAFELLAWELSEHGDVTALLDALPGMASAANGLALQDEREASDREAQGDLGASRYHARSARYSHGLVEGYGRASELLGGPHAGKPPAPVI